MIIIKIINILDNTIDYEILLICLT